MYTCVDYNSLLHHTVAYKSMDHDTWYTKFEAKKINSIAQMDAYPLSHIDELLDQLWKAKCSSKLDLAKHYWQVPVDLKAQELTAFTTPIGMY